MANKQKNTFIEKISVLLCEKENNCKTKLGIKRQQKKTERKNDSHKFIYLPLVKYSTICDRPAAATKKMNALKMYKYINHTFFFLFRKEVCLLLYLDLSFFALNGQGMFLITWIA